RVETLEVALPDLAMALDPVRGGLERLRLEAPRSTLPDLAHGHEARALQHLEVLGDGRLADVEGRGELPHRRLSGRQTREDRAAGGIREREERGVELIAELHE